MTDKIDESLDKIDIEFGIAPNLAEGGQGSGHFDHKGIPGHKGGSQPESGSWQDQWQKDWDAQLASWKKDSPPPEEKKKVPEEKYDGPEINFKETDWSTKESLSPEEQKSLYHHQVLPMLHEIKANPDFPEGYCAAVSTKLWEKLRKPKDFWPYSVFVGEEEHVILFNKKNGWAFDPTGKQFEIPLYSGDPRERYKNFHKLTSEEIGWALDEYSALLGENSTGVYKMTDKIDETLDQIDTEFGIAHEGGLGSGNFGHSGRPGQEGGSAPSSNPYSSLSFKDASHQVMQDMMAGIYRGPWVVGDREASLELPEGGKAVIQVTAEHYVTGAYVAGTVDQQRYKVGVQLVTYSPKTGGDKSRYGRWDNNWIFSVKVRPPEREAALQRAVTKFQKLFGGKK